MVQEYWLINPFDGEVEVYTHNGQKFDKTGHFNQDNLIKSRMSEFSNSKISAQSIFE